MDYEKAYKEMAQRVKELHEAGNALTKMQMEIICPELAESDDVRIRKKIIESAKEYYKEHYEGKNPQGRGVVIQSYCDGALAYLEKQKEQKPVELSEGDKLCISVLESFVISFIDSIPNLEEPYRRNVKRGLQLIKSRNDLYKPAEWSKEDEKIRRNLMSLLVNMRGDRITEETYQKYYPWLKSLRLWKPSEGQMEVFFKANPVNLMPEELSVYHSLYNDLKKLCL